MPLSDRNNAVAQHHACDISLVNPGLVWGYSFIASVLLVRLIL